MGWNNRSFIITAILLMFCAANLAQADSATTSLDQITGSCHSLRDLFATPEDFYNRAFDADNRLDYQTALAYLNCALERNPNYAPAYLARANVYYDLGDYRRSIDDASKVIALKGDRLSDAYYDRGIAYLALSNYDQARIELDIAIKLAPGWAYAYLSRGTLEVYQGNYEKGLAYYDRAFALDPTIISLYVYRGTAYEGLGKLDQALEAYTQAIANDPTLLDAYLDRAKLYTRLHEYLKAIDDYNTALDLAPADRILQIKALLQQVENEQSPNCCGLEQ